MSNCPKCNKPVRAQDRICPHCFNPLPQSSATEPKSKRRSLSRFLVIVLLGLIGGGAVVWFYWEYKVRPRLEGLGVREPKITKSFPSWGKVVGQFVTQMPYPALNKLFDETFPPGLQNYWKGNYARQLSDKAIELYTEYGAKIPNEQSSIFFYPVNAACHSLGSEDTAFAYRDINFATFIAGTWPDVSDNERNIQWVRDCYDALRPYSEEAGYVNAMSDCEQDQVATNYRQNYKRLVQLKAKYDPNNLFQLNQNISPAT